LFSGFVAKELSVNFISLSTLKNTKGGSLITVSEHAGIYDDLKPFLACQNDDSDMGNLQRVSGKRQIGGCLLLNLSIDHSWLAVLLWGWHGSRHKEIPEHNINSRRHG